MLITLIYFLLKTKNRLCLHLLHTYICQAAGINCLESDMKAKAKISKFCFGLSFIFHENVHSVRAKKYVLLFYH